MGSRPRRHEAHVAILPAGARGRGEAKPTCATISGGKLPRTPRGRQRPTAREPRGILPPRPRENLTWRTWRIATWKHGPRGDFYTFTVSGGKHVGQGAWTRSECPAHEKLTTIYISVKSVRSEPLVLSVNGDDSYACARMIGRGIRPRQP